MTIANASSAEPSSDQAITQASVTIAWVILLNKPFYPLYIWWFLGTGALTSCLTMLGAPLFALVIWLARHDSYKARVALPIAGLIDVVAETFVFGGQSGTELLLVACGMLAALSFREAEIWTKRILVGAIFVAFITFHGRYGAPLFPWSETQLETLRSINIYATASLCAFIALRYPSRP